MNIWMKMKYVQVPIRLVVCDKKQWLQNTCATMITIDCMSNWLNLVLNCKDYACCVFVFTLLNSIFFKQEF